MPEINPLTPSSGEFVPDPLRDLAETREPAPTTDPPTGTVGLRAGGATRSQQPLGDPTAPWGAGGLPPASHVPGYEILGLLGRGGMGVVYRARQIALDRVVALKLMLHAGHAGTIARERFKTEARAVARMQHPNIVQVFEVGEIDGIPFLTLEHVPGGTLADRVAEHLLPPSDAAQLVAALAAAVQYAHAQGVIHRDIKPANVLLASGGREPPVGSPEDQTGGSRPPLALTPKVSDFGLAKSLLDDSGVTRSGAVVGTPSYMPPEQASGDPAAVGPPADIYALGAVLYELLTGRPPFKGANVAETLELVRTAEPTSPTALQPSVPRDLETVCLKCLRKEPAQRYATARDLGEDLTRFLNGVPILARPVGTGERAWRWCKRNPAVASLLGTVMLLLALVAVGSTVAAVLVNEQRREVAKQRDEADRQRRIAQTRLTVYQKAVDGFVNEAPALIDGHPLGSTPTRDLLELSGKLLRDVQDTGVEDNGLGLRGEMSALIRKGHLAKTEGRVDDAAKCYDDAFKMGEELLRTTTPEEKGKNTGNLALIIGQRASMIRIRAETEAGRGDKAKAREVFAEAVKMHHEAIALFRRVVAEPDLRDIHPGEARCWLGGGCFELAETHRLSVVAFEDEAGRRAAHEAARAASKEAEEQFAAGLATGGIERQLDRTRLRQALAVWEVAKAADKLNLDAEADAAFQRCFDLFDRLVKDTPKNLLHRIQFGKLAADQGTFLMMKMGDGKRAGAAFAVAVEQSRRVGRPGELNQYHNNMAANLYRAGVAAVQIGDKVRAKELFRRCVAAHEEQLREAIRISSERSLYTVYPRTRLMFAQARAGDHASAAAYAAQLRGDYDKNAEKLSFAAQGFALCAAATDDDEQATEYRNRALEALKQAADHGYENIAEVERDPDYDPLRGDDRFAPLLERVKANAAKKK